jgi:hypothetical protein
LKKRNPPARGIVRYLPLSGMILAFSKYKKVPLAKIDTAHYKPAKIS